MTIQQLALSSLPSPPEHPECYPKFPTPEHWTTWICPLMIEYLSYPYDFHPRQDPSVWQAYNRCRLPAPLKDFVHQALWAKLPVGERLVSWKALEVTCPLNRSTIQHALFHCKFVDTAFTHISACFHEWTEGPHGINFCWTRRRLTRCSRRSEF